MTRGGFPAHSRRASDHLCDHPVRSVETAPTAADHLREHQVVITLPSVTGTTGARQVSPRQLDHRVDAHPCRAEQLVSTRSQVRTSPRSWVVSPLAVLRCALPRSKLSAVMPSRASSRLASSRQSVAPVQLSPLVGPARCTWPTNGPRLYARPGRRRVHRESAPTSSAWRSDVWTPASGDRGPGCTSTAG